MKYDFYRIVLPLFSKLKQFVFISNEFKYVCILFKNMYMLPTKY